MGVYQRFDFNPIALGAQTVASSPVNSAQFNLARTTNIDTFKSDNTTVASWEYKGAMRHLRAVMMISAAGGGSGRMYVQGLVPGQSGASTFHWRNLQDTGVQTTNGAYDVQFDGPVPAIIRLQLVIATATITAGCWLEVGG